MWSLTSDGVPGPSTRASASPGATGNRLNGSAPERRNAPSSVRSRLRSRVQRGRWMEGTRWSIVGAGGVTIGLLSAGEGAPLLLVHGGVGQIERWAPVWDLLTSRSRVTAMDRRGRGSSGDGDEYHLEDEFGDVAAVATCLADEAGVPVSVFGHSFGATCTLGAAAAGGPSGGSPSMSPRVLRQCHPIR